MVSLIYFFSIKLGQFQPVEAMHQPVVVCFATGSMWPFGFWGKNWQCQPVEEHPKPVANWFATGCHLPLWDVHQEMASVNRSRTQVYRLYNRSTVSSLLHAFSQFFSFLLPIDGRGKLGHLNGELSKPVALQNESHFHQIFVYANTSSIILKD